MSDATDMSEPVSGLYERLMTQLLDAQIGELTSVGRWSLERTVDEASSPDVLARHITDAVRNVLSGLEPGERVAAANQVLESLAHAHGASESVELIAEGPRELLAIADQEAPGVYTVRPTTPLSESALITNASEDPNLGFELRAELATADRVDLLCAFVKWHGLRVLEESLHAARDRGVPIRVITTTYMGATERRALDRLVRDFGAEVKINYEVRSTRLHAKAWLFRRRTGYDTAYVGSSNLSRAALLDGLEWNVRLSSVATPAVLKKFEATFDSYWSEPVFEDYDPDRDAERLDAALAAAGSTFAGDGSKERISLSGLGVQPYPHQQDMLERLKIEREIHDRHRNLLVAATGTGKTVMAALDFKSLREKNGPDLSLLFVAHRQEILKQALAKYREILDDPDFGEESVAGKRPEAWKQVFASVQSLTARPLDRFAADHFDVVVIDEFHHAEAVTYRRIIDYFQPLEFLGLTATPERMDGKHVQEQFFGGRIAAEMRLWEALENDLLSPFHYFGIADGTDLSQVSWKRGAYDSAQLADVFTGNEARARLVLKAVKDKISDPGAMRALGFCVSVSHARYMADYFGRAGVRAIALDGSTPQDVRENALRQLKEGEIQVIFSVDLFNEGLDIPDVDTLLLLRPTGSATIFLQQLGRGLRRTSTKAVLTVLDFIGQHRAEFRFEEQFRAMTNFTRGRLVAHMERDFPQLPSGCQIILDRKSKETVLANIKTQLKFDVRQLAEEVRAYGAPALSDYLAESRRGISEIYKGNGHSWTGLLRRAKLLPTAGPQGESDLLKRVHAFLHVDDPVRVAAYQELLSDSAPSYDSLSPVGQGYARMLFYTLWDKGGGFSSYQEGLDALRVQSDARSEIRQVLAYCLERAEHYPIPLESPHDGLPLTVHSSYNRSEILAALGIARFGGQMPGAFAQGVVWCPEIKTDALLITLEKNEKDFSATTRYKDYAMSPTLFHWESQSGTSRESVTGKRYRQHVEGGTHVLLFGRRYNETDIDKAQPWMLLGPAEHVSSEGSKPMSVVWRLTHPLPADVWTYAAIAAG